MTGSPISSRNYIQLGFTSYDLPVNILKLLKTFETSEMYDFKVISSKNSINSDKSTRRYAHSSGGWKSQTRPTDTCKDNDAHSIVSNIYPVIPRHEASNNLSDIFSRLILTKKTICILQKHNFCSEPMIVRKIRQLKL